MIWKMPLRKARIFAIAALGAFAAAGGRAEEIEGNSGPGFLAGYSDGDLVLTFFSTADAAQTSGVNSYGDVLFDLGPAAGFTGLAPGTYSVAGFDGSATSGQGPLGWGSSALNLSITVPSSSTYPRIPNTATLTPAICE